MRFCMVTTFYPPYNFGGDGIAVWRLTNALARRGHTVEVVHSADAYRLLTRAGPRGAYPNERNVTVHTLHSKAGSFSPLITQQTGLPGFTGPALREIIDNGRFDVIHFHNMSLIGPAALAYGPSDAIRLYTTHDHWLVCPMHVLWKYDQRICERRDCITCQLHGRRPPQLWRHVPLLRRWLRHVDAFIAPSRFTLDMHQARGQEWGFGELPFHHIPHFLPSDEIQGSAFDAQEITPGMPSDRPYFLFVGRLERIKGLQNVIEVFRSYSHADLLIAGDGDHGNELRLQAAELPHVRFLGRLPGAELRRLYRGATAVVVPSICYEVFGLVIIEAFAMRTPVIAHDLGALPEIIEESGGGFVYRTESELVNAMERLRLEPGLGQQLGDAGYATYSCRWTEERHLESYFGLLGEIAGRRGLCMPDLAVTASMNQRPAIPV